MKYLYSIFILLLIGCSTEHSNTPAYKQIHLQDSIIPIDSSEVTVESEPDTIPDNSWDKPMLVIENCNALWNEECYRDSTYFSVTPLKVQNYLLDNQLLSFGKMGMQNQQIDSSFCMYGECGQNQKALYLSNKEYTGILTGKNFVLDNSEYYPFESGDKPNMYTNSLSILDTSYSTRIQYSTANNNRVIQMVSREYEQENGWPLHTDIQWRIINPTKNDEISAWYSFAFQTTNLPVPIGIIVDDVMERIIWKQAEGICCPSYSRSWVTKTDSTGTINGKYWPGGYGQPCD